MSQGLTACIGDQESRREKETKLSVVGGDVEEAVADVEGVKRGAEEAKPDVEVKRKV